MFMFERKAVPTKAGGPTPRPAKAGRPRPRTFSHDTGDPQFGRIRNSIAAPTVQRMPTVSRPGDAYEREADQVADQVMRNASTPRIGSSPQLLQRECSECEEEKSIQRKCEAASSEAIAPDVTAAVSATHRGGDPLPAATRRFFEPHFGYDFSQVRTHTDPTAAEALGARAFTLGHHLVFGAGEYAPTTATGMRLLAHELTHVVQQSNTAAATGATIQRELEDGSAESSPASTSAEDTSDTKAPDPCAGWESDPQSFAIELAKFFYRTEYPNPKSANPSVISVTGAWDPKVAFWVNFDNGDTVGVSMKHVPTKHMAVACAKVGNLCDINNRCEYSYTCSNIGSITFSKIRCRSSAPP